MSSENKSWGSESFCARRLDMELASEECEGRVEVIGAPSASLRGDVGGGAMARAKSDAREPRGVLLLLEEGARPAASRAASSSASSAEGVESVEWSKDRA